jgi:hypothetical protein
MHFCAAGSMWALMQLCTDCMYGTGASAKALYAAKTVPRRIMKAAQRKAGAATNAAAGRKAA